MPKQFWISFVSISVATGLWGLIRFRRPHWNVYPLVSALISAIVAVPALVLRTPLSIGIACVTLGAMLWERMTPRVQYDNDKDKSLDRSGVAYAAIFIAVKRLLLMMFGYLSLKFLLTTYPSPIRIVEHLPMWAALVIGLLWSDFINYWVHRSEHWSDFLWEFHKVHHASERMTVLAAARTHVFSFYVLVQGGHVAAAWLIGLPAEALLVIEVFDVVFAGVWAHANIDFPKHRMPWWGYVLATPNIHGTHHGLDSRCNYGQVFVLWDFLFGTYRPVDRAFIYGIGDSTYTNSNLWWQQVEPFIGAFNVLKRSVRRIGRPIASDVPQTRV